MFEGVLHSAVPFKRYTRPRLLWMYYRATNRRLRSLPLSPPPAPKRARLPVARCQTRSELRNPPPR